MITYVFKVDGQFVCSADEPHWFLPLRQQYPNGVIEQVDTDAPPVSDPIPADQPQPVADGVQTL